MIGLSASWPISVRIALSGFTGVVVSVLSVLIYSGHGDPVSSYDALFAKVLLSLGFGMIILQAALLLTGPLIVIAIVCGVLFKRFIERHLLLSSFAAPVIVWLFVCVVEALTRQNHYFATHGLLDRLAVTIRARDNLLFLFGPFVSDMVFYVLSAPRSRRSI